MNPLSAQEQEAGSMMKIPMDKVLDNLVSTMEPPEEKVVEPAPKPAEPAAQTTQSTPEAEVQKQEVIVEAPKTVEKIVTKEPELKLSKEDEDHVSYLKGDEPSGENKSVEEKKVPAKKEIDLETKNKLAEYESILSDPLTKAIAEFRKSGGSDINDFVKKAGLIDAGKLSIEELYSMQAKQIGFEGDELKEAVEEKMASFGQLPKLDQRNIEKELREKAKSEQAERLKSFTIDSSANTEEYNKVNKIASAEIESRAKLLANKKWRGFLITDELSKAVQELAPNYALPIFDESETRIIGYNVDDAIEFAIWMAADRGRKILKANFDMGETAGFEKAMKDRTRITENISTSTITPSSSNNTDEVKDAVKEVSVGKTGIVSLSGGQKKT